MSISQISSQERVNQIKACFLSNSREPGQLESLGETIFIQPLEAAVKSLLENLNTIINLPVSEIKKQRREQEIERDFTALVDKLARSTYIARIMLDNINRQGAIEYEEVLCLEEILDTITQFLPPLEQTKQNPSQDEPFKELCKLIQTTINEITPQNSTELYSAINTTEYARRKLLSSHSNQRQKEALEEIEVFNPLLRRLDELLAQIGGEHRIVNIGASSGDITDTRVTDDIKEVASKELVSKLEDIATLDHRQIERINELGGKFGHQALPIILHYAEIFFSNISSLPSKIQSIYNHLFFAALSKLPQTAATMEKVNANDEQEIKRIIMKFGKATSSRPLEHYVPVLKASLLEVMLGRLVYTTPYRQRKPSLNDIRKILVTLGLIKIIRNPQSVAELIKTLELSLSCNDP